jgi:hypothetical protein
VGSVVGLVLVVCACWALVPLGVARVVAKRRGDPGALARLVLRRELDAANHVLHQLPPLPSPGASEGGDPSPGPCVGDVRRCLGLVRALRPALPPVAPGREERACRGQAFDASLVLQETAGLGRHLVPGDPDSEARTALQVGHTSTGEAVDMCGCVCVCVCECVWVYLRVWVCVSGVLGF